MSVCLFVKTEDEAERERERERERALASGRAAVAIVTQQRIWVAEEGGEVTHG